MDNSLGLVGVESFSVAEWHIVFRTETRVPWLKWRAWGRFKHVLCFGYVPVADCWVFFDPGDSKSDLLIVPTSMVDPILQAVASDDAVLKVRPQECRRRSRMWVSCVQMVAHLCGVPSCALRPDTFWRHCVENGAEVITDVRPVWNQGRSEEGEQSA